MPQKLVVKMDSSGHPKAEVPFSCMWDLVEFLSLHRVAVSYEYRATHFTVCFLRKEKEAAQQLLDEWANSTVMAEV